MNALKSIALLLLGLATVIVFSPLLIMGSFLYTCQKHHTAID